MAAPAKLEFDSWMETVRKHIELADQSPRTSGPNFHGEKQTQTSECAPVQEALESLKSLHNELVVRAASIDLTSSFSPEMTRQMSSQVVDQVASTLTAQLSQQLSDQLSILFDAKLKQFNSVESRVGESETAEESETLTKRIVELETELANLQSCSLSTEEQLRQSADEGESQLTAVQEELSLAYETIALLEVKLADSKNSEWSVDRDSESRSAENEAIAELKAEIVSLQAVLAASRTDCWQVTDTSSDSAKLTAELAVLKQQNSDLASKLAEAQSSLHNPPHLCLSTLNQESMTWEQRKKLIMKQFEDESAAENRTGTSRNQIEIEDILCTTQAEIERRDAEIAELKAIVEQQSNTHSGVAIGAAAIAQMLDSDELVKLEREKLGAIQREWEGKLREAEVQISTERAKLSRERVELQSQMRILAEQAVNLPLSTNSVPETKADGKPVRRWLEHLGLRDK